MTGSNSAGRESTPPNQTSTASCQSSCICTLLERPGFVQTHADSRRALSLLVPPSPSVNQTTTSKTQSVPAAPKRPVVNDVVDIDFQDRTVDVVIECSCVAMWYSSVADIDLAQDSDVENSKATTDAKKEKYSCDAPKLHYNKPYKAADQISARINKSTHSNLETHCDGSLQGNQLRKSCVGRAKAITQGANLPESAEQKDAAKVKKAGPSGTLTNYVQKGRFDVKVMNQMLV
ncbi:hypothetical protein H4Q26_007621 [Puccinia striiformis f. sp. tritici PST-130]|uniref:Uncharacterized protein n=1 Tax=Puccinia striiformis f. sp. tritici PST-78 TaxID=1165861 RepID=A0A0L0VBV4_9BASI|nr:hypothetical protein H4Q26_007621 [Puccinia striiformis f. sp. tritici PST-130]KNE96748.1 hypothetical protein PSTG_10021 [Puccinia striiformis f. sp. tritici PST-78]